MRFGLRRGATAERTIRLSAHIQSWWRSFAGSLLPYLQIVRLLPGVNLHLTIAVASGVLIGAALPVAFTVAAGTLVGSIPATIEGGFDSTSGLFTLLVLAVMAVLFLAMRTVDDLRTTVAEALGRRLDVQLQQRLIGVTSQPFGIAHLEDPATQNRIAQAREGVVTGWYSPGGTVAPLANTAALFLQIVGALLLVAAFRWWLALLLFGAWTIASHTFRSAFLRDTEVANQQMSFMRRSTYFRDLVLTPAAAKEIRLWGMLEWLAGRFSAEWLRTIAPAWQERSHGHPIFIRAALAFQAVQFVVYAFIGWSATRGDIDFAALAVLVAAISRIDPAAGLNGDTIRLAHGVAGLPPLHELEQMAERLAASADGGGGHVSAAGLPCHDICFEGVSFRYPGQDVPTLANLDLCIRAGTSLAIVGSNGAGKTTLIKLLCRLYAPTTGRITIDGVDIEQFDPHDWQRQVAAIFQDFVQYQLPVRENVAFGPVERAADFDALVRLASAAGKAGALEMIESLPHGWDTVLSRQFTGGADLSGGQWQRIALARAFFAAQSGARTLILDEPTANLDVRAEAQLYDRFLEITQGLTTILISHRFSTVRRADQIVVLEGGRVTEQGSHAELMALCGRYAQMFTLQASRFDDSAVEVC